MNDFNSLSNKKPKKLMKVFMLIKWLHNSGAPKMFMWLANALAKQGHEVRVCTYQNQYEGNLSPNVEHVDFTNEHRGFFGRIARIRKEIKVFQADVSISFLLDANVYSVLACYGLKTKSVICERNDPFKPKYYKLKFWKPWFRLADGAVFQLPKVATYYNNIKSRTAIIPNPVDRTELEVKKSFTARDDEIVTVGRIDIFQKRHDVLVEAFAEFRETHPTYRLTIYGGGEDKDVRQLKSMIKQLGVEDAVCLAGAVANSTERILNAKMFVLSSDFEGIPNALIEAMSVGLPCISTDCRPGGARLLIENGKNGLVVAPGNASALTEKMLYLAENPDAADSMGREAREISEKFAPEKIIKQWEDYLTALVIPL
ncbi:MAG: glycosyltransferase [Prevotella sp.]|nr:glycosyltransferase [Prevotella sp.]